MKFASYLAIYFVIWWIVLFAVLPFGIRNAEEAGEAVPQGHEAGAPMVHGLRKKFLITSLIAAVVLAVVYMALQSNILGS